MGRQVYNEAQGDLSIYLSIRNIKKYIQRNKNATADNDVISKAVLSRTAMKLINKSLNRPVQLKIILAKCSTKNKTRLR